MDAIRAFDAMQTFYFICAAAGGLLLALRIAMQFAGLDNESDADLDAPTGDMHLDADVSFKLLTLQGITAFFLFFGLVGLILYKPGAAGTILSLAGATAAGGASMFAIAKIFTMMLKLQASGNIDTKSALGSEGTVYLRIPKDGTGKVQIKVQNRLREYDAVSDDGEEIASGQNIRVTWIKGNVMVVEKI